MYVNSTLHRVRTTKINFLPQPLKIVVVFFNGSTNLLHTSNTTSEIIDLRRICPIKICCSSRILNVFCSREVDKVVNQERIHRIDQPSIDNGIFGSLSPE